MVVIFELDVAHEHTLTLTAFRNRGINNQGYFVFTAETHNTRQLAHRHGMHDICYQLTQDLYLSKRVDQLPPTI